MDIKIKENLKETYNKYAHVREKNEAQQWKTETRELFLNFIKKENKKSLLEIGCGHGRDSKFFIENGLAVISTDISDEMVKVCKEKGINALELDFYNLHTINKTFDSVWALNCLLHIEKKSLPKVLMEINEVLNPSGLFFMGVYGGEESEGIWEDDIYSPPRFFSSYTDEHIKEVVSQYFEIVSFKRIETGGEKHFQSLILRKKNI